jgi:hypothetical protein
MNSLNVEGEMARELTEPAAPQSWQQLAMETSDASEV